MNVTGFFAGGEWIRPSRGATIKVVDPASEETYGSVPRGLGVDARSVVHAARWAFDEGPWPRMSAAERAALLRAFSVECQVERERLVECAIHEWGATRRQAEALLVGPALEAIAWYADRASRDTESRLPDHAGPPAASSLLVREPCGVAGIVAAGAEPLACLAHTAVAALAAGNTVAIKAPSTAPLSAFVLAECAARAGLPAGVLNVVSGPGRDAGAELCENAMVDVVAVAGTTATGRKVAQRAAATAKTTVAMLGATGTTVVLDGADPAEIAAHVAKTWLAHAGQAWGAACRLVATRSVHDALVDALAGYVKGLTVGDPSDAKTDSGPVRSKKALDRAIALVEDAVAEGARLVAGGGRPEHLAQGFYLEPAILTGAGDRSRVAREEIAAPILAVFPADGDEDALRIANDRSDGVVAHVWGRDRDHALAFARRVRAASVYAQGGGGNPWAPAGGYGPAGLGRFKGLTGIDAFTESKHISTPPA
jgi:acyl-CoA reductase-like NAD-dependent aldehyde dehydrogenase